MVKPKVELNEREVRLALMELEAARNENWKVESNGKCVFVEMCVQEFRNLGWDTNKCIEKITEAKYKKQYGLTKFSDFTEDEEGLINYTLIKYKAICFLERKEFVDARQYKALLGYYTAARNRILAVSDAEGEARKAVNGIQVKSKLNSILNKILGELVSALSREGLLTNEVDKVIGDCKSNFKKLFSSANGKEFL